MPKRAYDSTRRKAQAGQTRSQIAEAALRLFSTWGYSGATVEAIAAEAGVSAPTIYATFGSKRNILHHLLDTSLGGDDAPLLLHETDQRRQLAMLALGCVGIMDRAAPVFEVMRMAAKTEPEIASLLQGFLQERWRNMCSQMEAVEANGPLRDAMTARQAADIVWTLTSAEVHSLLRNDRGWDSLQQVSWLQDCLTRLILP